MICTVPGSGVAGTSGLSFGAAVGSASTVGFSVGSGVGVYSGTAVACGVGEAAARCSPAAASVLQPEAESKTAPIRPAAASVRTEVRGVLAPVNDAFANLLDSLLQDAALDVSAEADALKAVLSQEGIVEGGLAVHAAPKTEEKER